MPRPRILTCDGCGLEWPNIGKSSPMLVCPRCSGIMLDLVGTEVEPWEQKFLDSEWFRGYMASFEMIMYLVGLHSYDIDGLTDEERAMLRRHTVGQEVESGRLEVRLKK